MCKPNPQTAVTSYTENLQHYIRASAIQYMGNVLPIHARRKVQLRICMTLCNMLEVTPVFDHGLV